MDKNVKKPVRSKKINKFILIVYNINSFNDYIKKSLVNSINIVIR